MKYETNLTAKEVKNVGTIVHDVFDEGLRFIIMRGPLHWCGYIGIPKDHPLAGFSYDDISLISAHGGLTFAERYNASYEELQEMIYNALQEIREETEKQLRKKIPIARLTHNREQELLEKVKKILMDNISIDTLKTKEEMDKVYEKLEELK